MEYLSTTSLANELDIPANELFSILKSKGWIDRNKDKWILTAAGKSKGGETRNNPKFGEYIVWPENLDIQNSTAKSRFLNATAVGKQFGVSSQRLNLILSELGWVEKDLAGWKISKLGKTVGGRQCEHETSGGTYVIWPETVLSDKNLIAAFTVLPVSEVAVSVNQVGQTSQVQPSTAGNNFREKFEAKHRTKDGHYVRSRGELIIDNTLYDYGVVHAYEKKLPIEEDVYCDFYLPSKNVFVEYWGLENDDKYLQRKKTKLEIYRKYEFNLIELTDEDIANLDDNLPRKLLKFGIKVY